MTKDIPGVNIWIEDALITEIDKNSRRQSGLVDFQGDGTILIDEEIWQSIIQQQKCSGYFKSHWSFDAFQGIPDF